MRDYFAAFRMATPIENGAENDQTSPINDVTAGNPSYSFENTEISNPDSLGNMRVTEGNRLKIVTHVTLETEEGVTQFYQENQMRNNRYPRYTEITNNSYDFDEEGRHPRI